MEVTDSDASWDLLLIIDADLVTTCSNRYNAKSGETDFLTVDIYARQDESEYKLIKHGLSFIEFFDERGIEIIPISPEDEEHFGNNFICLKGREILMVAGKSENL